MGTVREYRRVNGRCHESKHFGGGSALEVGDLRLLEDGSQRSCSLGSDVVVFETASEGQDGKR